MKRLHAGALTAGLVLFFATYGQFAQAQIVTCDLCRYCDFFVVIHNAFNFFALQITAPLATLMFILGGLILMFGGSNPQLLTRAKTILKTTIIGVLIVLFSWVIVNTTINIVTGGNSVVGGGGIAPWNSPQCGSSGIPQCPTPQCQFCKNDCLHSWSSGDESCAEQCDSICSVC